MQDANAHRSAHERGFGLIEVIIAIAIVTILGGVIISQMRGAKTVTLRKEAEVAAAAYDQAIAGFQADNANRNPTAANMISLGGMPAGPGNLLGKSYLKNVPDGVTAKRVAVNLTSCAPPNSAVARAAIAFCPAAAPQYAIRVYTRPSTTAGWKLACVRGNTAAKPRCA